jgi:hypothetical protein
MIRKPLELYDLNFKRIGYLTTNTGSTAKNIQDSRKINEIGTLTFDISVNHPLFINIIPENIVKYNGEFYFIKTPTQKDGDSGLNVSVSCRHLSNGLDGMLVDNIKVISCTATELMTYLLEGVIPQSQLDIINSTKNTTSLLDDDEVITPSIPPTGWTVGVIDISDSFVGAVRSLEQSNQSIFGLLTKVAELFNKAHLTFHSDTMKVDLSDINPYRDIQIIKGKNLKDLSVDFNTDDIVTRLYPFGGQDLFTGSDITINMNIVDQDGTITTPCAKDKDGNDVTVSYIENYSYYLNQKNDDDSDKYTQEYISNHPALFKKELVWNASDYTNPQALYDDAIIKLKELSMPKISCSVATLDLSDIPEYFILSPILGEKVKIVDKDLSLDLEAYVTEISTNSETPMNIQLTISNVIHYNSILKALIDSTNVVSKNTNGVGQTKGAYINGLISLLSARVESVNSRITTDKQGNLLIEDKDQKMAMKIGGGIFAIANSKVLDGDGNPTANYDWRTFGTGAGFYADSVTTGVLRGEKILLNLDSSEHVIKNANEQTAYFQMPSGSFIIANNIDTDTLSNYQLYYDGTNLNIGKDVKFNWTSLDGNGLPIENNDTAGNYITSITNNTISTATIRANQLIMGGTNGTISWDNVTDENGVSVAYKLNNLDLSGVDLSNYYNKDEIIQQLTPMLTKGNFNTVLGSDFIITSKFYANQVLAGQMIGVTIKTIPDTDDTTPTYVELQEQNIIFNAKGTDGAYHQQFKISCNPDDVGWSGGVDTNAPQLFFNQYCSIDTDGNRARFRRDRFNYLVVDDQSFSFYSRDGDTGNSKTLFSVSESGITFNGSPFTGGGSGVAVFG